MDKSHLISLLLLYYRRTSTQRSLYGWLYIYIYIYYTKVRELRRVSHRESGFRPVRRLTPLQQTRQQQLPHCKGEGKSIRQALGWQVLQPYRYGEPGHRSNECLNRKQVNMTDYEREDEMEIETEPEDFDFAEEYGVDYLRGTMVVMQPKGPDTTKRHHIFYSVFGQEQGV